MKNEKKWWDDGLWRRRGRKQLTSTELPLHLFVERESGHPATKGLITNSSVVMSKQWFWKCPYTLYSHLFQISVFSECNASLLAVEWWRIELADRLAKPGRHLSLLVRSCSPSLLLDCLFAEDWLAPCPQLQHAFIEGNKVMMWPRTGRWCWDLWREVCNYFWQQWLCTSKISSILAPRPFYRRGLATGQAPADIFRIIFRYCVLVETFSGNI